MREARFSSRGGEEKHAHADRSRAVSATVPESPAQIRQIRRGAGVATSPREAKRGRPLAKDAAKTLAATKPWEALGMSRRTWYRRQKERQA